MNSIDFKIQQEVEIFFKQNIEVLSDFKKSNTFIKKISGINNFFNDQNEASGIIDIINEKTSFSSESTGREYGDYQTNEVLSEKIVKLIFKKIKDVEFILEPTCGKGNFIISALENLPVIKKITGVEIYQPYVWETKFRILSLYIKNPSKNKPDIDIIHANAFEFSYEKLSNSTVKLKTLVIGNPPWVTNSELGSINSSNLPQKSNFKNHKGFEAITGKGNFDIGEYISLVMLKNFQYHNGIFAFLIKNSVVKNLIHDQKHNKFLISKSEKHNIDSKKEFNVSVNASLFLTKLNNQPDFTCQEFNFYNKNLITTFGWLNEKFVYSIKDYNHSGSIDGESIFIWRSGLKHDCSKIMELKKTNDFFVNGLGQNIALENDLIYGILKSSDLKNIETNKYRKQTIVTQKKVGQDTSYIKKNYPLTFEYLNHNKKYFDKRKSSIYKNKPNFSIFGIGDYSFLKFKVAISGLYKTTHFTLVTPNNNKALMLDDTCYFIGFDELQFAQIAHYLLNSDIVQRFLKSIIFSDSKRSVNKDILMRIDFERVYNKTNYEIINKCIDNLSLDKWNEFGNLIRQSTKSK